MLYRFDGYELDPGKVELRRDGAEIALEPQVFALLVLLVENRERLLSKDEIVEKIWDGRAISDSAIASCIKSARKAVGDNGSDQKLIRTVHGRGFRFVADVDLAFPASPAPVEEGGDQAHRLVEGDRPSIAVLPFKALGMLEGHGAIADAIPHELISALSRLRWLFVLARGSTFRFRSPQLDVSEIGQALNARYCLSGIVELFGKRITIAVELTDTRNGGVLWGERYYSPIDEVHEIRSQIVASIVSALEMYIPENEARMARLTVPENLDTWAAYHLGLQRMYRFNRQDNAAAAALFRSAIEREPAFARAHAGLSFTHFQDAFLERDANPASDIDQARACAERAMEIDPLDPFANFNMGRTFWLTGELEESLAWLERAVSLSPNYAQGIYARAWTETISGHGAEGRRFVDEAMALSPLDPFLYAMRATRAFSFMVEGDHDTAVIWADKGARAPGAHFLIGMIAVIAHSMAGNDEKAASWAAKVKERRPDASSAHFFRSFPFACDLVRKEISTALARNGFG